MDAEDMRKQMRHQINQHKEAELPGLMVQRAVDALADRLVGDVPQYYVDFIRQDVGREMMQSFEKQGTSLQEWLLNNNGKADEIKENVTQEAIRRARIDCALEALVAEKGFDVTEEDIEKELAQEDDAIATREKWEKANRMAELRKVCRHSKASLWLVQTAEVTVVDLNQHRNAQARCGTLAGRQKREMNMDLGSTVTLVYTGKLEDGTVFGYATEENPMVFQTGMDMAIDGFEKEILAMEGVEGEKKTFTVGEYLDDYVVVIPTHQIPKRDIKVGSRLWMANDEGEPTLGTVIEIEGGNAKFDLNHPLAGKDLTFEVEIKSVEAAPENFVSEHEKRQHMKEQSKLLGGDQGESYR